MDKYRFSVYITILFDGYLTGKQKKQDFKTEQPDIQSKVYLTVI